MSALVSTALLGLALLARWHCGTLINPSSIMSLFWFLMTFFPLIFIPAEVNSFGIIYIVGAILAFAGTSVIIPHKIALRTPLSHNFDAHGAWLGRVALGSSFIAFLAMAAQLAEFAPLLRPDLESLMAFAGAMVARRYEGSMQGGPFMSVAFISMYVSAASAGMAIASRTVKAKVLVASGAMAPAILQMTLFGNKGSLPLCLVYFLGGYFAISLLNGNRVVFTRRFLKSCLVVVIPFVALMWFAFISRGYSGVSDSAARADHLLRSFASYSGGHIYAFSDWYSWYLSEGSSLAYDSIDLTYGFYSAAFFFNAIGLGLEVPPGFYGEYYRYEQILQTNIYTAFRGLILDFGVIGSLVVMSTIGLITNLCYMLLFSRSLSVVITCALYLVYYFGAVYTSMIISPLTWGSPIFAFIVLRALFFWRHSAQLRNTR